MARAGLDCLVGFPNSGQAPARHRHADWDEFIQGIVQTRQQLADWRAAGNDNFPPTWISVEEYRRIRGLPAKGR
jgi:hypothetical protein